MTHSSRTGPQTGNSQLPTIAEWLQGEPNPWPGIAEPGEGARYLACYVVESKQLLRTKDDKPYLRIQLADRSGTIEGRVWDDAERIDSWIEAGQYVGVAGRIQSFRNQRQLKVEEIREIEVGSGELDLFLPATDLDLEFLEAELDEMIASVADNQLRTLLDLLVGEESETGLAFRRAPAAKRNHHAYIGGLLEHSVSIAQIADSLARHYAEHVDRDLLITGAILHDIGKIEEIAVTGGFPYTDQGKLLGHILIGLDLVRDAAARVNGLDEQRLLLVLHLIASHQGKYEWQSPRIPHTIEALILHFADDLDAKMNQARALVDSVEDGWTPYDPSFGREFLRHYEPKETLDQNATPPTPRQKAESPIKKDGNPRKRRPSKADAAALTSRVGAGAENNEGEEVVDPRQVSIFDLI